MALNKVLIDTNVCLDAAKRRQPFAESAIKILAYSESQEIEGYVAAHSFDTIFYFLEENYGRSRAYDALKGLRKAVKICPVTQQVIDAAFDLEWNDFEDAIHHESALQIGCDAIITRNEKDFKKTKIPVLSPGKFLDHLN
ncbi:MAG: PIN domain-containing protein [Balneolaceae bacterium]